MEKRISELLLKEVDIDSFDNKQLKEYCNDLVGALNILADRINETEEMHLNAQEDVIKYSRKVEDLQNEINLMETTKYNLEIENYELSEQVKTLRGALKILAKE